jgi:hypothetical protein
LFGRLQEKIFESVCRYYRPHRFKLNFGDKFGRSTVLDYLVIEKPTPHRIMKLPGNRKPLYG